MIFVHFYVTLPLRVHLPNLVLECCLRCFKSDLSPDLGQISTWRCLETAATRSRATRTRGKRFCNLGNLWNVFATCLVRFGSVCGRHWQSTVQCLRGCWNHFSENREYRVLLGVHQGVCKSTLLQWDVVTNTENSQRKQKQRVGLPCGVYVSLVRAARVKSCDFDPNLEINPIWNISYKKSRILLLS